MSEKVVIGNAELYHGDCMEVLPGLGKVDAVITDPPYGIGEARDKNASRSKPSVRNPNRVDHAISYGQADWDDEPLDAERIALIRDAGKWCVIFGGNFYDLPPSSCWLVWDKINGKSDFADCELAWTNLPKAVRLIRFMWNGMLRDGKEKCGHHPTQKPIKVMSWAIEQCPQAETVLDPLMGSGTTGVAAVNLGRKFIGIELERKYFDIACERIDAAQRQGDLFVPERSGDAYDQVTLDYEG